MIPWYKRNQIRNLVDMHIPNGEGYLEKFDPAAYAENVKKSGATCAYIYSCNCLGLCFYPTKIGLRHKEADRDIFGETVKECRKRGLDVVGYANTWMTFVADEHPEWQTVRPDGTTKREKERYGTPCASNDEFVDYVCARSYELVSSYKLDGFWLDMIGVAAPVCHCKACKEKYEKKFGRPLPLAVDKHDPEIYDYLAFKADVIRNYLDRVIAAVKKADPDISIAFQTSHATTFPLYYGTEACLDLSDYLSGDFYTNREGVNVTCRMLYKATNNLPFEFMTSRCVDLERHTMNKDINELINQSYAALMYKGAFLFIDAIDPDGEMNSEFYDDISVISKNTEKYLPYIDFEEKPVREVGVYYNYLSWLTRAEGKSDIMTMKKQYLFDELRSLDSILAANHVDYELISQKHLDDIKNYKVMIFPSLTCVTAKEAEAIREYVANGGKAYVSGITSLYDDKGTPCENFTLSDLLGVDYKGRFEIKPAYLAPTKAGTERKLFGNHTRKYPHMLEENIVKVTPNDKGTVLATVTLPVSDVKNNIVFSSAISNPPINYTEYPALFEHNYGKGRVIYSAGFIEGDPMPDSAQLLTAIIKDLVGEYRIKLDAPKCVDFTAYEKDNYVTLHLLNSQNIYPPIRIDESMISAKVALCGKTVKSVTDVTGGNTEWSIADGMLTVKTDLEDYKFIKIEFEA